jgi:hypothetical protein
VTHARHQIPQARARWDHPDRAGRRQLIAATGWTLLTLAVTWEQYRTSPPVPGPHSPFSAPASTTSSTTESFATKDPPASVVTYLVPIVSVALGAAALSEPLNPSLLTGIAISVAYHPDQTVHTKSIAATVD